VVAVPSIGRASQVTPRRAAPEADATRDLYERYARQIYAYCHHQLGNREEAEDATQSTFLNAFRGFKRGVDPEFESAWLYKIAQNVCLTRQRSSSRRRRVESPGDLDAIQDILPSHEIDSDELIGLPEALQGLPKQQQRALLLREWQGLSYKEIAEELDLTQSAVETLLFRARRSLAAGLGEDSATGKSVISKLRAGTDAGSLLALLQSLLSFGGAKAAVTVATVAASSVVATTPTARHAVEHVVAPQTPHQATQAARASTPRARHSFVASTAPDAGAPATHAATARSSTSTATKHAPVSFRAARHVPLSVGHRPRATASPDRTVRSVAPQAAVAQATQPAPVPTPTPAPPPAEPVVDLPPAAVVATVAARPAPVEKAKDEKSDVRGAIPAVPAPARSGDKHVSTDATSDRGGRHSEKPGRRETQATAPVPTTPAVVPAAPADPQAPAPTETVAPPTWQPPGNVEKKEAREARDARKGKERHQDAQTLPPTAPAAPAPATPAPPAPPAAPTSAALPVATPTPPSVTTSTPVPADESKDRGEHGHGRRK
jgi:RNA polymerase sigma-70 factor (ECF subfamily)